MRKVTIVGCGLVGALWAYLMKKQGYDVEVFEKRSDPQKVTEQAGRSINLVITSRGLFALELAGLLDVILPITVPVYGRRIHPKNGESFFQPYGRDKTECNYSVSRWFLNKSLIEQCLKLGVKINFDHEVKDIDIETKTLILKNDKKSITHNYDLLFVTEGAGSTIRKTLALKYPQEFKETTDWLASGYKELFMPMPTPELEQQSLEKNSLHIWPRATHMLMGLANLDGSFTTTLYLPNKNHEFSFENINHAAAIENLFNKEFKSAIKYMPHYLEDYQKNPVGLLGTVKMNKWTYRDSLALMGDAAHAIVPFFGQGMNLGFEDCTSLSKLIQHHNGNWQLALSAFDQQQRPNANAIADMALENFVEMRDKVSDPTFQLNKKIESLLEKEFPDLYRSRYGMITYTLIPYSIAQEAGKIQTEMLNIFSAGITDPSELDLKMIKKELETNFYPWLKNKGFNTKSYTLK